MEADSVQREPLYFGGVTSFEAVWEGFGEQDTAVVFGLLVGMLVGFSDLGVQNILLDLFWGVGSGAVNFVVSCIYRISTPMLMMNSIGDYDNSRMNEWIGYYSYNQLTDVECERGRASYSN